MTKLRESVAAALEDKTRAAFTEGEIGTGSCDRFDRIQVANLPFTPRQVWSQLVGILDSLPGVALAQPFQVQAVNDQRIEVTGALSDHAEQDATYTVVTVSYWVRGQVGELKISLLWTPKEHGKSHNLEQPPPEETGEATPGSRAVSFAPETLQRSSPHTPYSPGHP